ncbi:MAG TPA: VanZ family protein [Coriobacteriia bacterium]
MTPRRSPIPTPSRAALLRAVPALVWAAIIFAGSSIPGSDLPGGFSMPGHLTEYAVLGALVMLAVSRPGAERRAAFLALLVCSAYGVTDEFHQAFVPLRTPDPVDWATDTFGAALGVSAMLLWLRARALRGRA